MTSVLGTNVLYAQMQSGTYRIDFDSVNSGGGQSQSANYLTESTVGEIATGSSTSATYNLQAGYQQMHEVYLTITAANDVAMSPSIGGITGGTSNGSTAVTVTTDSATGYQLQIKASSSPALVSGVNSFADYTPASADPDYNFSIAATASEFGFSPEGSHIPARYKDNGFFCNSGTGSTADSCWDPLSTVDKIIAQNAGANTPSGTATVIKFRASSGASRFQPAGNYVATTTLTALPN